MLKKIGWTILIALLVIQFIRPAKNQTSAPQPHAIQTKFSVPENVSAILKKACYDCHSNNSEYPWYSNIQPVYWWLNDHIAEGKGNLNFDEYTNKRLRFQYHKMEEVISEVKEGEMPLESYTWVHGEAKLSTEEKAALTGWAQNVMDSLKAHYPIDSLMKPQKQMPKITENENHQNVPGYDEYDRKPAGAERQHKK
ncbi:MAG: heme-binding domain-containing protein [Bacteroidota bacterium]